MASSAGLALGCLLLFQAMTSAVTQEKVRMCYFTSWSQYRFGSARFLPADIDPFLCTHILYAFAHIDLSSNSLKMVEPHDAQFSQQIIAMKTVNPQLKVLLAVGGASQGTDSFEEMASNKPRTHQFTNNVISFLRNNRFDGLDVDWEFPNGTTRSDFQTFIQLLSIGFMTESVASGRRKLQLTVAVHGDPASVAVNYGPRAFIYFVDYVLLMAYDLWGTWSNTLGHHSPLRPVIPDHYEQGRFSMTKLVEEWTLNGAPKTKLVLGLSTYGHTGVLTSASLHSPGDVWARHMGTAGPLTRLVGYLAYYEICDNLKNPDWRSEYSNSGDVPYAWNGNDLQYVCYDDPRSFAVKANYILDEGLAGAMFWALDYDDFTGQFCNAGAYPLLRQVKAVLDGAIGVPDVRNSVTQNAPGSDNTETQKRAGLSQSPLRSTTTTTIKTSQTTTTTTTTKTPSTAATTISVAAVVRSAAVPRSRSSGGGCPPFKCSSLFGFYPDHEDCSHFYQCSFSRPYRKKCPPSLLFDSRRGLCDWTFLAKCEVKC